MRDYKVLKRCRLIPNFLIFDSSVCRGGPSFAAAPAGKRAFQDTPERSHGAEIEPIAFLPFHRHRHRDYRNEQIGACFETGSQSEMPTTALGG
jgi:hypothetical protein